MHMKQRCKNSPHTGCAPKGVAGDAPKAGVAVCPKGEAGAVAPKPVIRHIFFSKGRQKGPQGLCEAIDEPHTHCIGGQRRQSQAAPIPVEPKPPKAMAPEVLDAEFYTIL